MQEPSLLPKLQTELKRLMKRDKVTYAHLAKKIGFSESGFKKFITAKDCSLLKIEKVCRELGLSLADIIQSLETQTFAEFAFSAAQEEYFFKNRLGFLLYWFLTSERRETVEVQNLLSLNEKELNRLLLQLDKLDLIKVLPEGKIQIPQVQPIYWSPSSKFVTKLNERWQNDLLKSVPNESPNTVYLARYLQMSKSTYKDFQAAIRDLETTFMSRGMLEMRLREPNLGHVRWLLAMDRESCGERELNNGKTWI